MPAFPGRTAVSANENLISAIRAIWPENNLSAMIDDALKEYLDSRIASFTASDGDDPHGSDGGNVPTRRTVRNQSNRTQNPRRNAPKRTR